MPRIYFRSSQFVVWRKENRKNDLKRFSDPQADNNVVSVDFLWNFAPEFLLLWKRDLSGLVSTFGGFRSQKHHEGKKVQYIVLQNNHHEFWGVTGTAGLYDS